MLPPPVMTKKVTTEFASENWPEWIEESVAKLNKMWVQRKTDKERTVFADGRFGGIRYFTDQAAADEWVAFITAMATRLDRNIISIEVSDI
jgi:hypothetical protein